MRRLTSAAVSLAAIVLASSCHRSTNRTPIDLLQVLPAAERRAAGPIDQSVFVDGVTIEGDTRVAIVLQAPARVTWQLRFPRTARFQACAALVPGVGPPNAGVIVRLGIADNRTYQEIARTTFDRSAGTAAGAPSTWISLPIRAGNGVSFINLRALRGS